MTSPNSFFIFSSCADYESDLYICINDIISLVERITLTVLPVDLTISSILE